VDARADGMVTEQSIDEGEVRDDRKREVGSIQEFRKVQDERFIIGSDGKSFKSNHSKLNVKPVVKKLNNGRIIVVFVVNRKDPLVKSLLDKYANYT
jgi:hypothetical protein